MGVRMSLKANTLQQPWHKQDVALSVGVPEKPPLVWVLMDEEVLQRGCLPWLSLDYERVKVARCGYGHLACR